MKIEAGIQNETRNRRLTSSKIHVICAKQTRISQITGEKWGVPALTYFEEKRLESKFGRSLDTGAHSRAIAWGNFMENIASSKMPPEYQLVSNETVTHPNKDLSPYWSGSCDLIVPKDTVAEIKCYGLKKFGQYTDVIIEKDLQKLKDNFAQEYWQIVSNCILNDCPNGEAVTFAPHEDDMEWIREIAENLDQSDQWKYRFIVEDSNWNMAVLSSKGIYEDLNRFKFEVPKEDIELITEMVYRAIPEITVKF